MHILKLARVTFSLTVAESKWHENVGCWRGVRQPSAAATAKPALALQLHQQP